MRFKDTLLFTVWMFCVWSLVTPSTISASQLKREQSAKIRVENQSIPTYLMGPENPNPQLWPQGMWRSKVYPYPMQDNFLNIKKNKVYKVVVMENRYIKVLIMPEVGGRILGAHDKTYNNEDFLYHNHVIKPALVGLRGAWLSGGIEWNFPSLGHAVSTVSPVHYEIKNNPDGSVTCVLGETEYVRRMWWSVSLTLYPDRSYIEVVPTLYNRTLLTQNGYFWSNAAVHATNDCQVIFPPTRCVFTWDKSHFLSWPKDNGVDISWFENISHPGDFFCDSLGSFNGCYYHQKDCGIVHCANPFQSPGKKFWTWGTAPCGDIWVDILTDHDGQYIEVQAGRLKNMADSWLFKPHAVERWKEYWYPVKKMGGYVKANSRVALNCELKGKEVFIALNVTEPIRDGTLELLSGGKKIYTGEIQNLTPDSYWSKNISLKDTSNLEVILWSWNGRKLIHYLKDEVGPCEKKSPSTSTRPESTMTAAELYNKGLAEEKDWRYKEAARLYRKALKKDPALIPAHLRLALFLYKKGEYTGSLAYLNKAVKLDRDRPVSRYYRALSLLKIGNREKAKKDLWWAKRYPEFTSVASYLLGEIYLRENSLSKAEDLLRESLERNPRDFKAQGMLSATLRKENKLKEARSEVKELLKENPIYPLANAENYFLNRDPQTRDHLKKLLRNPQDYLEVAISYGNAGLYDEAIAVLDMYEPEVRRMNPIFEDRRKRVNPMIWYYKGYYYFMKGEESEAQKAFDHGCGLSPDYVFPSRLESFEVLNTVLKYNPRDWKAYLYLGNFLTSNFRWEEGLEAYREAEGINDKFSVLHRNIARILQEKKEDIKGAIEEYEKAIECNPDDFNYYVALDGLYTKQGLNEKRIKLFKKAPSKVKSDFRIKLHQALLNVHLGKYEEAIKILKENKFHSLSEVSTFAHDIWVKANIGQGLFLLRKGEFEGAVRRFQAATEYPGNLRIGAPAETIAPRAYYLEGLCYEKMNDKAGAFRFWKKAVKEPTGKYHKQPYVKISIPSWSEGSYYKALAFRKLGEESKANELLQRIVEIGSSKTTLHSRDLYVLGLGWLGKGKEGRARQLFEKAIEKEPNFIEAKWQLKLIKGGKDK